MCIGCARQATPLSLGLSDVTRASVNVEACVVRIQLVVELAIEQYSLDVKSK